MITFTQPRAMLHALICAWALTSVSSAMAQQQRPAAVKMVASAQNQPLRFFTLAGRVEALRAKGTLPPASDDRPTTSPVALQSDDIPSAQNIGLRLSPPIPVAPQDVLLGAIALPIPNGELAEKWQGMMVRWAADEIRIRKCEAGKCTHQGIRKWLEIRDHAASMEGIERLGYVHAALNRSITYATDFQIYGVADYWASPLESVERAGDCEDYVIAKFLLLRSVGIAAADMKLVALHENFSGQYHAILGVRDGDQWVFMDNKRMALSHEQDYTDTRALATVDETGQSMLVLLPVDQASLRLKLL